MHYIVYYLNTVHPPCNWYT